MTYDQFKKDCAKFEEKHGSLIGDYNDYSLIPFKNATHELWECYSKYLKIVKTCSPEQFLRLLIERSVADETDFLEVFSTIFSENAVFGDDNDGLNFIQMYFDEVKDRYDKNDNNYDIEYCEENREKLIEMNLKTVISIAKNFRGRGVAFEDLISAGNLGLCKAFEKYDPSRAVARERVLDIVSKFPEGNLDVDKVKMELNESIHYGNVKKKLAVFLEGKTTITRADLIKWVKTSVHSAKFNSVATMWIKAYIIEELNANSRPVKKPKTEIDKELKWRADSENPYKDKFVYLDDTLNDDTSTTYNEIMTLTEETPNRDESLQTVKIILNDLLEGVSSRDRRILLQKFGIGYPRELTPKEIAEREDLSPVRVCQVVNSVLETMQKNQELKQIDAATVWEALSELQ